MRILITGANGFIGSNLVTFLRSHSKFEIFSLEHTEPKRNIQRKLLQADVIIHCAGLNVTEVSEEYMKVNAGYTKRILDYCIELEITPAFILLSSTQASQQNPYGTSKSIAEKEVLHYGQQNNGNISILRLPNVFGRNAKPNYNSFVATLCYSTMYDKPYQIFDNNRVYQLLYIDDLNRQILEIVSNQSYEVEPQILNITSISCGELVEKVQIIRDSLNRGYIPEMEDQFSKNLYSTYVSYLNQDCWSRSLAMHIDERGFFTEVYKTTTHGQFSIVMVKPGQIRGNHYHLSKFERFTVISGAARFEFKNVLTDETKNLEVFADQITEIIAIPGWNHVIRNIGDEPLLMLVWVNEVYNSINSDTFQIEEMK